LRLRDWMNAARLVSLSGTSSMLASQDTSRRPNRNAPGVAVVARPPRTRANSAAGGARPTRRRACVSPDVDGGSPGTDDIQGVVLTESPHEGEAGGQM
jgi:hypothetical protein